MTTLSKTIRAGGYELRQVERRGKWAIYEQIRGGVPLSWEVIEIQERGAETIHGRQYEPRETYPSAEMWGEKAWSCPSLERAQQRLHGLTAKP